MIYTTYSLLAGADTLMDRLEGMTGARGVYGFNTPINMVDINNGIGLETATAVMPYAADDPTEVSKTIGIEWVKASLDVWNRLYPGDTRIFDMMYFTEQYRLASNTTEERVDYCGDPIPGGGADINLAQINDLRGALIILRDSINPQVYAGPIYETYFQNTPDDALQHMVDLNQGYLSYDTTPMTDDVRSTVDNIPGYVPGTTASKINDDALISDTATYDPNNTFEFKRVNYQPPGGDGAYDPRKQAAVNMIEAAILASDMSTNRAFAALTTIFTYITLAYYNFAQNEKINYGPILSKLRDVGSLGLSPPLTARADFQPYMDQIRSSELDARTTALRDPAFVQQHGDPLNTGFLTLAGRIALENAVRDVMKTARMSKAQELYASVVSQQQSWDTYVAGQLGPVFNLYVV